MPHNVSVIHVFTQEGLTHHMVGSYAAKKFLQPKGSIAEEAREEDLQKREQGPEDMHHGG